MVIRTSRRWHLSLPIIALAILLGVSGTLSGQNQDILPHSIGTTVSTELHSPWEHDAYGRPRHNPELASKSCLDLIALKLGCKRINISYGNRFGDNWDILAFHGTQSRMIDLGKGELSDENAAPYIAPYRALGPGEKRHIAVNTSGGDGADGKPGLNGDGTSAPYSPRPKRESFANKPIARQVSSKTETINGEVVEDRYNPFLEARTGHVYALRVFEGQIDRYFLLRVDEVTRGQKIKITVKSVSAPKDRPVF